MQQDLSNARIIEWGEGDATFVGARTSPRNGFRTVSANAGGAANHVGFITELVAEQIGARVVAEFPRPSLAEVVGDAPAFLFENCGESYIAYRVSPVTWVVRRSKAVESFTHSYLGLDAFQADYHKLDPASVVPLFPREVVS